MPKFRIDPAAPPIVRGPPPAAAPVAPPPTAPLPAPVQRLAEAPPTRRGRKLAWLALVVILLLVGGTVAALFVTDAGPFRYPRAYLLEEGETPTGLRLEALPSVLREEFGLEENPGRVPDDKMDPLVLQDRPDVVPEEAWVESVGNGRFGEQVVIVAARMASEDDARTLAGSAGNGCNGRDGAGTAMRDGDVVVMVFALDGEGASRVRLVESALREKTPELSIVCRW